MNRHHPSDPVSIRVEAVAQLLNIAPSTVRYWIRNGQLPAHKIGRSWRVRIEDIRRLYPVEGAVE